MSDHNRFELFDCTIRDQDASLSFSAEIADTAVIGAVPRRLLTGVQWEREIGPTIVADRVWIGDWVMLEMGAQVDEGSVLDTYAKVAVGAKVGRRTLLGSRAEVGPWANVGDNCVVGAGALVCEAAVVRDGARVFGSLAHAQLDPTTPWDAPGPGEPSPIIEEEAFVGKDALVIGGTVISHRAYVCAGAVVTRDVPPLHIASGTNTILHYEQWKGRLATSRFFREE